MEREKSILATNLTILRKAEKLTQIELAEVLSYSDKSISKWENGDTVPDLDTLIALSNYYNLPLDTLCKTPLDESAVKSNQVEGLKKRRALTRNKIIITLLSISLVWFIATFVFVHLLLLYDYKYWMAFIWALPLSCLICVIFCSIWSSHKSIIAAVSALVWTLLFALHLNFVSLGFDNFATLYFLGIPAQIALILWSKLNFKSSKSTTNH